MFWKRKSALPDHRIEPHRILQIKDELCVHSISIFASCRSCVDVCPDGAMIMDDAMLGLDESACSACGLCQAACGQNAISIAGEALEQGDKLLLVCDKTMPDYGRHRVSCVHQTGMEQLAGYYRKGVRNIIVATADCATCHYHTKLGNGHGKTLSERCREFNILARSRDLVPIKLDTALPPLMAQWAKVVADKELENADRRKLFTGFSDHLVNELADPALEEAGSQLAEFQHFNAEHINAEQSKAVFCTVPHINEARCDGCEACIRICPSQALTRVNEKLSQDCYKITPHNCTGCGLCQDVCSAQAVSLQAMSVCKTDTVSLQRFTCTSCGVVCHVPGLGNDEGSLCRICSQTEHHKKLFQVLT